MKLEGRSPTQSVRLSLCLHVYTPVVGGVDEVETVGEVADPIRQTLIPFPGYNQIHRRAHCEWTIVVGDLRLLSAIGNIVI